jgi:hypothetical protein
VLKLQFRVTLYTGFRAWRMEKHIGERANAAARQMWRATWGLVLARTVLVLATVGLLVATIAHG